MTKASAAKSIARYAGLLATAVFFVAGVTLLLLWLAGTFAPKVSQIVADSRESVSSLQGTVAEAKTIKIAREETAVGTIRAVHETTIGSKLMARVLVVNLKAGQSVKAGETLVKLDDADLIAKLEQASAAVDSADAALAQAVSDERRYSELLKSKAIARQDYEKAVTAVKASEAELRRLRELRKETQVMLDWATIQSPIDGTVIDKKVDVGDLVRPGQVLVTLFDPKRMQLVASVRESLVQELEVGQEIGVNIQGIRKRCSGTISEIVPEAQAASRAFQVKVTGPCPAGVYTGMFARLLIPLEDENVLVIPATAVSQVGQLELVNVPADGHVLRRAVRTGRKFDEDVEVLSGLRAGEKVVVPDSNQARTEIDHE